MDKTLFNQLILGWIALGVIVFPLTLFITAPFGRHYKKQFGPTIGNRLGWFIMEAPAVWWFTLVFVSGVSSKNYVAWFLWGLWTFHYINRCLVYPLRTRTRGKRIPVLIVAFALFFQLFNGYVNGMELGQFGDRYLSDWLARPTFWIGLILFGVGWLINIGSDEILLHLRKPSETGYKIPYGGLFRWVSCPNFFGEIILWTGWAMMCWNLAAVSFAVWTFANLVPRALAHHRWYREHFPEYPSDRNAVFPGLL